MVRCDDSRVSTMSTFLCTLPRLSPAGCCSVTKLLYPCLSTATGSLAANNMRHRCFQGLYLSICAMNKRLYYCPTTKNKKVKSSIAVNVYIHLTATECHLPYGITQCYLPPDTSEHCPTLPFRNKLTLFFIVLRYRLVIYTSDDHALNCLRWFEAVLLNTAVNAKRANCEQCWRRVINSSSKLLH